MNPCPKVTYKVGPANVTSFVDPNAESYAEVCISYKDKTGKLIEQGVMLPYDAAVELGAAMGDEEVSRTLLDFKGASDHQWNPGWGGFTLPIIARKIAKFSSMHLNYMSDSLKCINIRVNLQTGAWQLQDAEGVQKNKVIKEMLIVGDPSGLKHAS